MKRSHRCTGCPHRAVISAQLWYTFSRSLKATIRRVDEQQRLAAISAAFAVWFAQPMLHLLAPGISSIALNATASGGVCVDG